MAQSPVQQTEFTGVQVNDDLVGVTKVHVAARERLSERNLTDGSHATGYSAKTIPVSALASTISWCSAKYSATSG
jgi:hypothetical protein